MASWYSVSGSGVNGDKAKQPPSTPSSSSTPTNGCTDPEGHLGQANGKTIDYSGKSMDSSGESVLKCEYHPDLVLETYCKLHDDVLCRTCVSAHHSSCGGLVTISGMGGKFAKKRIKQTSKELKQMKTKLTKMRQAKRNQLKTIDSETVQAIQDVTDFRKFINWVLDRMERKGKEYIEKRQKVYSKQVNEDLDRCNEMLAVIEHRLKLLSRSEDDASTSAFNEVKKGKDAVKKAQTIAVENATNADLKPIIKFTIDPKVEQFARGLSWYGKDRTYLSYEPPITFPHLYTVRHSTQFDIRVKGDRHVCAVDSMCQLSNGTLLLADSSNKRLKQIDILYRLVDHLDLPSQPTAVCSMDDNTALVALTTGADGTIIQTVDATLKLRLADSFTIPGLCSGMACDSDVVYVSTADTIRRYSLTGEHLSDVYTTANSSHSIYSLTLNHDMAKLHFMDCNQRLTTVGTEGEVFGVVEDADFIGQCGLATDTNGQIFTCGHQTHAITQFNHDHCKLGPIASSKDLKFPLAIAFDRLHTRLVVSMKSKNIVKVFDLK